VKARGLLDGACLESYSSQMKKAGITETKNSQSALIDGLKGGGSPVLIMDRGRPVARLEPVSAGAEAGDERPALLADAWHEVEPGDVVRENAMRFLRVHPLRAADALQLGAAFVAAEKPVRVVLSRHARRASRRSGPKGGVRSRRVRKALNAAGGWELHAGCQELRLRE